MQILHVVADGEGVLRRKGRRRLTWPDANGCWSRSWCCREDQSVVGGGNNG